MSYKTELSKLDLDGYCVIDNVISKQKCRTYVNDMWNWLKEINPTINKDDSTTWLNNNFPVTFKGIIKQYYIGHANFMWNARLEPKVIKIFEEIWNTTNLLTSFDGANMMIPSNVKKYRHKNIVLNDGTELIGTWYHTDQSQKLKQKVCIQGLLNFVKTTKDDGCLVVLKGSHKYHTELFEHFGITNKSDWFKCSVEHLEWLLSHDDVSEVVVDAKEGSMVLWDSRVFHCNKPPTSINSTFRMCAYLCMTPKSFATKAEIKKKQKAYNEKRTTNHWPHRGKLVPLQYDKTRYTSKCDNTIVPNLDDHGESHLKMAGF
jgi:ectoine hydroxylase-related dioxygenase (phytanoyl-CoA dioxygenase family)